VRTSTEPSGDLSQASGRIDVILSVLERLDRDDKHKEALQLARSVNGLLALFYRWSDLVRSLGLARRAAEELHDLLSVAWVEHELGTLHLAAGNPGAGVQHLCEAADPPRARPRRAEGDGGQLPHVTLTANEDDGFLFTVWGGDCANQDNPCTPEMTRDRHTSPPRSSRRSRSPSWWKDPGAWRATRRASTARMSAPRSSRSPAAW
jgi:hypothetical protein